MTEESCKELLNINYKNMLLNPNNNTFIKSEQQTNVTTSLEQFLENKNEKKNEPIKIKSWSQLNKMEKINKINKYVDSITHEYKLNEKNVQELKQYLKVCLNRKLLQRVKDVQYDKNEGVIKKINGLQLKTNNTKDKKFTLKHCDRKDSTLKNLGSGKTKKKNFFKKCGIIENRNNKKDNEKIKLEE